MKSVIFIVVVLFSSTTVQAQQAILSLTDFCEWCDGTDGCKAKCNACKGKFAKDIERLEHYESKRLVEIKEGNFSSEEWNHQIMNLKAYCKSERSRITNSIQFCVQLEFRDEERERQAGTLTQQTDANATRENLTATQEIKISVAENIYSTGATMADTQQERNALNFQQARIAEINLQNAEQAVSQANRRIDDIDEQMKNIGSNFRGKDLKSQLKTQTEKSKNINQKADKDNSSLPLNCEGCPKDKIDEYIEVNKILNLE
ncbi:MAG: hypothetical protein LBS54_00895 [Dysgonamonadaceae bacterium]|jgi:hypothetical protein|nr:hypothetical protein [Dysgonamonadaceae bacterium]